MPMKYNEHVLIRNIYHMLAYAYQSLRHKDYADVETEDFENVHDMFASILAKGLACQIRRGLYREYVEREDSLFCLKGKINMPESIRLKIKNDLRLACRYDLLSENSYMNRILKSTACRLSRHEDVKPQTRDSLKKSLQYLSAVEPIDSSAIDWRFLNYHRNNITYRMLMDICRLALEGLLMSEVRGTHKLAVFEDEQKLWRLYEKFILAYCEKNFTQYDPKSRNIDWDVAEARGSTNYPPTMKCDIILSSGDEKFIIDAKCYSQIMRMFHNTASINSAHLYQLYAYVKNEDTQRTGKVTGALLYAKTDESTLPDNEYILGGNRFIVKTLDLNTPFDNIERQIRKLVSDWEPCSL